MESPYLTFQSETPVGGILYDITSVLSQYTGLRFSFVEIPRRRTDAAVADGRVNILFTHPSWTGHPESFSWSEPLFQSEYVVLTKKDFRSLGKTEDLKGLTLGTIFGYVYPDLDPLLSAGHLKREDVAAMSQNISKLLAGRIDGVYGDRILLEWLTRNLRRDLVIQPLRLGRYPISLAVTKNSGLDNEGILQACRALQSTQVPVKILMNYR